MAQYLFESDRLGFREMQASDLDSLHRMNSDPVVMEHFPSIRTREETLVGIRKNQSYYKKFGFGMWATDLLTTGQCIGFIGIGPVDYETPFTPCTEIGWRLQKDYWNLGLATEGAKQCLDYAFKTVLLKEIVSFTAIPNKPSERVMQKIGMKKQGEFKHVKLPSGHPLERHVWYKITAEEYSNLSS